MTKHLRMCKYARSKAADITGGKSVYFYMKLLWIERAGGGDSKGVGEAFSEAAQQDCIIMSSY